MGAYKIEMEKTKRCAKCGKTKPLGEFYQETGTKDGLTRRCKVCVKESQLRYYTKHREKVCERNRVWRAERPEYVSGYHLRSKYNITLSDYDTLLKAQNNGCAICGKTPEENGKRLAVDHDHETKGIRGLLCDTCNRGIGLLKDSARLLYIAAEYVTMYQEEIE